MQLAAIGLATALALASTTALAMGGGGGGGGSTYNSGAPAAPAATCVRHRVCKDGHCTMICR
jgi:hypothetical protein